MLTVRPFTRLESPAAPAVYEEHWECCKQPVGSCLCPVLPALLLECFPGGGTTHRQTPPTHLIRFNHRFREICLMRPMRGGGGNGGQVVTVAWPCCVSEDPAAAGGESQP